MCDLTERDTAHGHDVHARELTIVEKTRTSQEPGGRIDEEKRSVVRPDRARCADGQFVVLSVYFLGTISGSRAPFRTGGQIMDKVPYRR